MSKNILITDATHPVLEQRLREAGFVVDVDITADYDAILSRMADYDGVVVRSKIFVDRNFIDHSPRLRCIGRVGAGMETIDVTYAESKGIRCLNSPEGNRDAVGEHAVGLLLALLNNIARADAEIRQGLWQREANRGAELQYRTVGIIGFGNMGASFAQRLQGFGCRILAYDKYKFDYAPDYVQEVDLPTLMQQADVVSLHVPLTEETHHMADYEFFQSFAHPLVLVNTSRGGVVCTPDLVRSMEQGLVTGAALDVIEYENMTKDGLDLENLTSDFRYLLQSSHTVLSPHVAGWTRESKYKLAAVLADKIIETLCL
ncbi:MAG: hypothetical protein IJ764_05415 [Bacteroidales bacterium]|nr:hypothetical protein [Bacteroidales bacterium]